MAKAGFIGLGSMGGAMAANLIRAGHSVKVYDLDAALIDRLVEQGAEACRTTASAADDVEYLVSMLPDGGTVEGLYIDDDALLDFMDPSTVVIDTSTIAPESTRRVHDEAEKKGIVMIDAPVSGNTTDASNGTLTFICGGSAVNIEKARPILEGMGRKVIRAGDACAGQIAKLCNNMLMAINMIGSSEALQLGVDQGLDPAVLSEVLRESSGSNWALEANNPYPGVMDEAPATRAYEGGLSVQKICSDLQLALSIASSTGSATPLGSAAASLYRIQARSGNEQQDFSSILNLIAGLQS